MQQYDKGRKEHKGEGPVPDRTCDKVHVAGNDALVIAGVVVLPCLCGQTGAVAAVVEEEEVPGARVPDELRQRPADVGAGGLRPGGVAVEEDADVILVEAEAVDEAAVHAVHIVVAALELSLGAWVVDAHQERALAAHRGGVDLPSLRRRLRRRWPEEWVRVSSVGDRGMILFSFFLFYYLFFFCPKVRCVDWRFRSGRWGLVRCGLVQREGVPRAMSNAPFNAERYSLRKKDKNKSCSILYRFKLRI